MIYRVALPKINFTSSWKAKGTIITLPSHKDDYMIMILEAHL